MSDKIKVGDIVRIVKLVPDDYKRHITTNDVGVVYSILINTMYPYEVLFNRIVDDRYDQINKFSRTWQFARDQLELVHEASEDNKQILDTLLI